MLDETNLTYETDDIETLFDEPDEETETMESEPVQPAEEAAETEEAQTQPTEEQPQTFKVKHLGQEIDLTQDQLIANAQKGLDYDRIRQDRDALRDAPEMQIIRQYAQHNNMTVAEYRDYLAGAMRDEEVRRQMDAGVPEDVARQVIDLREKEQVRAAQERAEQQRKDELKQYQDLISMFPEVREMDKLPDEVVQGIAEGQLPALAYSLYRNRQLQNHFQAAEKARANVAKNPGPINGDAPSQDADLFDLGFNEVFNE